MEALAQPRAEPSAHALHGQEVGGVFGKTKRAIRAPGHPGHEVMDVRMIGELPGPGVEHAQEPELAAEVARLAGHVLQGGGAFLEYMEGTPLPALAQIDERKSP